MRLVGERWATGRWSVADEHLASRTLMRALEQVRPKLGPESRVGPVAVLAGAAGEQHMIGLVCLEQTLQEHGWTTANLGADVPTEDLARYVADNDVALVALSASDPARLGALGAAIGAVRDADRGRGIPGPPGRPHHRARRAGHRPRTRLGGHVARRGDGLCDLDRERGRLNRPRPRRRGPGRVPGQEPSTPRDGLGERRQRAHRARVVGDDREPADGHVHRRQDRPAPELLDHIDRRVHIRDAERDVPARIASARSPSAHDRRRRAGRPAGTRPGPCRRPPTAWDVQPNRPS